MERRGFLKLLGLAAADMAAIGFIPQAEPVERLKYKWTMLEPEYRQNIDAEAELLAMLEAQAKDDIDRNILSALGYQLT